MNYISNLIKLLSLSGLLFCATSMANMTVYPVVAEIKGGSEATTIQVTSRTGSIQYIRTLVKRVDNPATPQETEVPVKNMEGLVVSPEKLALSGGSIRTVRLIGLDTPEKETVYRVYFESVPSPDDSATTSSGSTVGINLVWGVLVRLLPLHPDYRIELSPDGAQILNVGNSRLHIQKISGCESGCPWQNIDRNIYPGQQLTLPAEKKLHELQMEYQTGNSAPQHAKLSAGKVLPLEITTNTVG
jgi:P pilus assembly chaperone PapD